MRVKYDGDVLVCNTDGGYALVRRMKVWFPVCVDLAQVTAFAVKVAGRTLGRDDWHAVAVSVATAAFPVLPAGLPLTEILMSEQEDYSNGKRLWEM